MYHSVRNKSYLENSRCTKERWKGNDGTGNNAVTFRGDHDSATGRSGEKTAKTQILYQVNLQAAWGGKRHPDMKLDKKKSICFIS